MTVLTTDNRRSYTGDGTTTQFSFPIFFLEEQDVKVALRIDDVESKPVFGDDYTVTGAGNPAGGTVTFVVAPPAAAIVVLFNDPPQTQTVDYQDNDEFPAETHERALDKLTIISQRLLAGLDRTLRFSETEQDLISASELLQRIKDAENAAAASEASASASAGSATASSGFATKASEWADKDTEVEPGRNSSKTWADISEQWAQTVNGPALRADIDQNTAAIASNANDIATNAAAIAAVQSQSRFPYRNLIVNGGMQVNQEGNKTDVGNNNYGCDLASFGVVGAALYDLTQIEDGPPGFATCLEVKVTTADASLAASDHTIVSFNVEGQNLQHLKKGLVSAESATLQVWTKTNKAGTYPVELLDNDNSRISTGSITVVGTGTWEQATITFPADTTGTLDNDNNASLRVNVWLSAGSTFTTGAAALAWAALVNANRAADLSVNFADTVGNYMRITGIQLEVGDTATDFEHLPYDVQLQRVQRYYQKFGSSLYTTRFNAVSTILSVPFLTTMRAAPTGTADDFRGAQFLPTSPNTAYLYRDGADGEAVIGLAMDARL